MDRLLCGDVGYGKTEVAMRAAFKAVIDGKQVAFLAPTTVLAFQHPRTLAERFAGFPVRIEMISRFRTKQEQTRGPQAARQPVRSTSSSAPTGCCRRTSSFRDLGLLVVDEEQRFGVAHKERIKQLRKRVDVLTMTATPIPRTLNMSLVGIRDMSVIETPPARPAGDPDAGRPVRDRRHRARHPHGTRARRTGVLRPQPRRVHLSRWPSLVARLVPEARLAVGHGQMGEQDLEKVMVDFVAHKYDVLVATTIVENGLDIPNANTIIINRADRYGLAQLYQLRGRVGRSDRRAYAYLLIPAEQTLSPVARRRLAAIREFSDLGSGFRIAALDLEIRGAGNLLGGQQSGHIEAVGFDMYLKLLEQTIRELKGEDLEDERRAAVNLRLDLRIDETYVARHEPAADDLSASRAARGSLDEVESAARGAPRPLRRAAGLRAATSRSTRGSGCSPTSIGLESLDREGTTVVLKFRQDAKIDPVRLAGWSRAAAT